MSVKKSDAIYHERQSLELCCLHVLNNLFQAHVFDKAGLDEICKNLSPDSYRFWNPHRSCLGLGNYDVNVLFAALQVKDCAAVWFDKRKSPTCLDLNNVIGFVLNIPSEPKVGPLKIPFVKRRHWLAIREIAGGYFNLDSKLSQPELIGDACDLLTYLEQKLVDAETQIFVVVSGQASSDQSYLLPAYRSLGD
uniref:ubiquitinyl hydrolase 1 n=1 Tax=Plectus sambesii TaxID=2011161 RepID=A0A914UUS8_9BILA